MSSHPKHQPPPKLDSNWFYTDSGDPGLESDDYSTVILIHGMGWHGASFQRMFPLAAGLRLVALNRRGYPGSAPYTPEELAMLASVSDHEEFHRAQGLALARIVDDLVSALRIPVGKLGILAWSAGTWFLLAMLAVVDDDSERLSADERARLGALVSHAVLIEPPAELMGSVPQVAAYAALRTSADPSELQRLATGYFSHAPEALSSRNIARLALSSPAPSPTPLSDRLTPTELTEMASQNLAASVDGPLFHPAWLRTHEACARTALRKIASDSWPRLKALHIVLGDRSFWLNYPGAWALQDYAAEMRLPPPVVKILPGGNHFMIIDHAVEMTALLKEIVSE